MRANSATNWQNERARAFAKLSLQQRWQIERERAKKILARSPAPPVEPVEIKADDPELVHWINHFDQLTHGKFNPHHKPSGPGGGEFTSGDGGGGDDKEGKHPGEGYSAGARVIDGVIHTSNVYDAQRALFENRKVELKQIKQVSTLIKRLGETAAEMAEHGEKIPVFNLCNVTVKGTNLFCAESKGIPRVEMPVIPAKRTKDFIKHLQKLGYDVEKGNEKAAHLRATQNEISGAKVATQMERIKKDGFYKRLVISKDDYILDGHHTWAGELGLDAKDGKLTNDKNVKIARVNISITKLIEEADKWMEAEGLKKKPADEAPKSFDPCMCGGPGGDQTDRPFQ